MSRLNAEILDEACEEMFQHRDWEYGESKTGTVTVVFYEQPRKAYLEEVKENG